MNTEAKMNGFTDFMEKSLSYLAYEFGCKLRCVKRSDIIPVCVEQVFSPKRTESATRKWAHCSGKVVYGLDCHGHPYAKVLINGMPHVVGITSPRKTAKCIITIIEFFEA